MVPPPAVLVRGAHRRRLLLQRHDVRAAREQHSARGDRLGQQAAFVAAEVED